MKLFGLSVKYVVVSKHLWIRNKTKRNKTKFIHQFDFGLPKQNKIKIFLILVHQNKTKLRFFWFWSTKINQNKTKSTKIETKLGFQFNFVTLSSPDLVKKKESTKKRNYIPYKFRCKKSQPWIFNICKLFLMKFNGESN